MADDKDTYKILLERDTNADDESNIIYLLNLILSGTARLNILLPTATILAFTIFAPLLTDDGECDKLSRILTAAFIVLCAASCVFFTFTDSFRAASGRLYYGVATMCGIWTFNGRRKGPADPAALRLRWPDVFHALLSLLAFVTFAGSHHDVVACYYSGLLRKVTNTVPSLVVGFAVSVLFVAFPSRRRGIGYPFLLRSDAVYLKRDRDLLKTNYFRRGGSNEAITRERINLKGYRIANGTRVIINAWAIGRDPRYWDAPDEFNPERFYNSEADFKGCDLQLIPFGAGRRICPGMQLAVSTIELALANLVHRFDWELPCGLERGGLDMSEALGFITSRKNRLQLIAKTYGNL